MEWTVHESKGETLDYYFLSDRKLANGVREGVTVRVGFNGLNIDCSISQLSGDFNETGFLDEPLIHFFTTFQVKAQPKLKDTPISSISPKRITTPTHEGG